MCNLVLCNEHESLCYQYQSIYNLVLYSEYEDLYWYTQVHCNAHESQLKCIQGVHNEHDIRQLNNFRSNYIRGSIRHSTRLDYPD